MPRAASDGRRYPDVGRGRKMPTARGICAGHSGGPWWRWRESNPRPSVLSQGFSGRSLQSHFSAPAVTQTSPPTGPVTVRFPAWSRDRTRQLSLLADARHRAEGTPGLTDFGLLLRQQERSQRDWNRRLLICWARFPRSSQRSSARFPWLDIQSRNRSPPMQLSTPILRHPSPPSEGERTGPRGRRQPL